MWPEPGHIQVGRWRTGLICSGVSKELQRDRYLDSGTSKAEEQMIFALKPKEKNQQRRPYSSNTQLMIEMSPHVTQG